MKKAVTKPLLVAGIVGTLGVGALATGAVASAQTGQANGGPMSSLVDKLSSTFNLDKSKVQQVVDQHRSEMATKHQQRISERLQKLVDNGTITAEQKTAIEAKLAELKKERQANKGQFKELLPEERKAKMEQRRTEMENWAKSEGVDLNKLRGIFHGSGHHGPRQ